MILGFDFDFDFDFDLKPNTAQPHILLFCVLLRLLTFQIFLGLPPS